MIHIKTPTEIEKMRVAGQYTAEVLQAVGALMKPGISTMEINRFCEDYIINTLKATPGTKGQYGFPYSVNTSLNDVLGHGIPSEKDILKSGDIINVDLTVQKYGYYGDSSKMFCIGAVSENARHLIDVTRECLFKGIALIKPGTCLGDIGSAVLMHARKHGYSIVPTHGGHGIGTQMHEDPQILHIGLPGHGIKLKEGMTFTLEPVVNEGTQFWKTVRREGWETHVTSDGKLSAQWEHTCLVTPDGVEILTLREEERHELDALIDR